MSLYGFNSFVNNHGRTNINNHSEAKTLSNLVVGETSHQIEASA